MKHFVTVLLLILWSYSAWRLWPREMKVYRARAEHIPMAEWKTADYELRDQNNHYVFMAPNISNCWNISTPTCTISAGTVEVSMSNIQVQSFGCVQ